MLRVRTALSGWEGGPGLMTAYFLTPLQDDAAALRAVGYVRQGLAVKLSGAFPSSVRLQVSGDVDVIDAATGSITDTRSVATPLVVPGVGSATQGPPAIAGLLQLRTGTFVAGRRVRGRIFVSPLAGENVTSDGKLGNTQQGIFTSVYTDLAALLEPGDLWVVWHRPKLGVGGSAAPITATSAPFKLAVLTSRRD